MIASTLQLRSLAVACVLFAAYAGSIDPASSEEARRFELRVEKGRLAGAPKVIQVRRNETVEIAWTADRRTVVHLHGYDIETVIEPGAASTMSFRAHATGRFPIEEHGKQGRHIVLIHLEVHPR